MTAWESLVPSDIHAEVLQWKLPRVYPLMYIRADEARLKSEEYYRLENLRSRLILHGNSTSDENAVHDESVKMRSKKDAQKQLVFPQLAVLITDLLPSPETDQHLFAWNDVASLNHGYLWTPRVWNAVLRSLPFDTSHIDFNYASTKDTPKDLHKGVFDITIVPFPNRVLTALIVAPDTTCFWYLSTGEIDIQHRDLELKHHFARLGAANTRQCYLEKHGSPAISPSTTTGRELLLTKIHENACQALLSALVMIITSGNERRRSMRNYSMMSIVQRLLQLKTGEFRTPPPS